MQQKERFFRDNWHIVVTAVFLGAFVLNVAWEFAHHVLYVHYRGGEITGLVLLRASLFDAFFIVICFSPFILMTDFRKMWWFPTVLAVMFAVGLEQFALQTGRWAYLPSMPVIPFLQTGLTPTIQLALTGLISSQVGVCVKKFLI